MGCEDMAIRRIEDRGLDRSPEDRLGVAEEEGIERVVSGDEDGECRLPRTAGAAGLLPQACASTRPAGDENGIEAADVDAQLESVGRGKPHQGACAQVSLEGPALLGKIPPSVCRDARLQVGRPVGEEASGPTGERFDTGSAAGEGDHLGVPGDQGSEQVGSLGGRRPASVLEHGRFPEGKGDRAAR